MKKINNTMVAFGIASMIVVGFAAAPVQAASDTVAFPSGASTLSGGVTNLGSGYGYFFRTGDGISETFNGTGLTSINELIINSSVPTNVLNNGGETDFNVQVNGNTVGSFVWTQADGTGPLLEDYTFAPITGNGTYTLSFIESNTVPGGEGSIAIDHASSTATLISSNATPEPATTATFGIFALGLAGLAFRARKRSQAGA